MGTPTVSQKIDAYAKAHLAELKKKQGLKNFTKYDIAEIMLKSGALTQAEMNSWRSTREGFSANNRSGSVFGSGYAGQESYLDEMTDFSQKSTFEKNLEIMNPTKLRYETPKQRKTRQAQYKQHVQDQQTSARIKNTKAYQNQEAMKKYLATLPPCTESFEELMASQKFESLDKSGKIKFLMEATGRKFYEAMEKGDKSAMRKYALEGMSYVFAYMDDKSGITDIKDAVKKYSGLNALVDVVDKIVDDGDADNLSGAEKTWATIKGAGDAVDGFIGTQGIAVMGSLYVAGEAAAAAGMAKLFAVATQAYFGIEGATLVYEGGKEIAEATTEEQARTGGTKLTSGAIMLAGTVKSVKQGYENYKASQAHKADIANARKTLGLEGDAPLTEASIKAAKKSLALANHPDRGGSVEAMQNINDAASLLLKELKGGTLATTTASTADPKADASKAMSELAKTPEGVKQMEDAGLVVSKASIDKLGTIHEGQSQSPARAIKKIDFSGSPEEVCAKNPPLQYDKARGKFYREVSWDGGKTKQPMYIEENDPNGYFMINYGEQPWDGALLGGTEAIKSYVEPEPYNTNGTKVALEPAKMDYNWTTASKAAPVRFAKVPEGIKGVVGKEGFQPITDNNQVVAIDVKGQPYINTAQYVLDNTKGLDTDAIRLLDDVNNPNKTTTVSERTLLQDRDDHIIQRDTESTYKDNEGNVRYTSLQQQILDNMVQDNVITTTTKYNTQTGEPIRSITTHAREGKTMYSDYGYHMGTISGKSKQFIEYDTEGNITRSTTKFTDSQNNVVGKEVLEFTPNGKKTKKFFTYETSSRAIRVGSEEIPNADGSTTVKLVAPNGQSFEQVIPKGKEYKIIFAYDYVEETYAFKIVYGKNLENSDAWTEKGFSIDNSNSKITVSTFNDEGHSATWVRGYTNHNKPPKTSIEEDFFK